MAILTFSVGTETSDWRVDLQDLLENGTLSPTTVPSVLMTLTSGDYVLTLSGVGLTASDGDTLTAGTITGFTLTDDGTTVLTMTGLLSTDYADLQGAIDGAGGLDPTSADFRDLVEPFIAGEALLVTGSDGNDVIYGSAFADTINAGDGDDQISGGAGADDIDGQGGSHDEIRYDWENGTQGVEVDLDTVGGGATDSFGDHDTIASLEGVWGTDFDDHLTGSFGTDALHGGDGFDVLFANFVMHAGGDDQMDPGPGGGSVAGIPGHDGLPVAGTLSDLGDRADYYLVEYNGSGVLVDLRPDFNGDVIQTTDVHTFAFADGSVDFDDLVSDVAPGTQYGSSDDDGGWAYGWHTTGGGTFVGWHYESGWDYGWYQNSWGYSGNAGGWGWGWAHGWYQHTGWEYGWYESGSWALGAYYDYGGWGLGWNTGSLTGGSGGVEYGSAPDLDYYGDSYDRGGWEYGWFQSGDWVYGWHQEVGWDVGWYQVDGGWAIGWFYHWGWENGWFEVGAGQYGWHYDYGGEGIGFNSGASSGAEAGNEYAGSAWVAPSWVVGWSSDTGGWEVGWYQAGNLAYGWHYESGWDHGWYMSESGWAWGWYTHVGWELGWFGYGAWAWGWHYDYGGLGAGWNLASDDGGWLGNEGPFAF